MMCMHIGSSSQMVITADDAPMDVLITLSPINIVQAAADLVWSRTLKKYRNLTFALSEGGIGWIPYFRERIDYTYERHRFWTGQDMGDRIPSQVLDEQVVVCFIDDPVGVELRHKMNIDMITWECDYPHSDSTWPQSPEFVTKQMDGVPDDDIDKMTHTNAMRLFNYDPFTTLGGRENCTVAALRSQAEGWDVSIKAQGIKASGHRRHGPAPNGDEEARLATALEPTALIPHAPGGASRGTSPRSPSAFSARCSATSTTIASPGWRLTMKLTTQSSQASVSAHHALVAIDPQVLHAAHLDPGCDTHTDARRRAAQDRRRASPPTPRPRRTSRRARAPSGRTTRPRSGSRAASPTTISTTTESASSPGGENTTRTPLRRDARRSSAFRRRRTRRSRRYRVVRCRPCNALTSDSRSTSSDASGQRRLAHVVAVDDEQHRPRAQHRARALRRVGDEPARKLRPRSPA